MTCASSRVMPSLSVTDHVMLTASPPKALRLASYPCSFTNVCAGPSPTAASIISPMPDIDPIAGSRQPTTVLMQRSRKSSICLPPLDAAASHCCTRFVKDPSGSHCHPWLFERSVTPRAGRILLSPGRRRSGGEQRVVEPADHRLPELGRGLCPQS